MKNFLRIPALAALLGISGLVATTQSASARTYDITVDEVTIKTSEFTKTGIGYNGASPGPVLKFKEGENVTINVTNNLDVDTSIHWHGLILPYQMDGVPKISYPGIKPGETFTYQFPIVQSGTYWFHSHSGFQEPDGAYGAIVIEPKKRETFHFDRDYVVQLTDSHPHSGSRIMRNLKMMPDYYNRQQQTLFDFFSDAEKNGFKETVQDRMAWGSMRMMPADVEDLQGFVPLINGKDQAQNWTGLFKPGERVRLRFINSSAMTYFDIRIPGLKMTVVGADGNGVQPVPVDEFRIGVAETYDVIVQPKEDKAYTIFAASMGRSAYGRATLAPRDGMEAEVPELGERPLLTMADMGMAHEGMDHGTMNHGAMNMNTQQSKNHADHQGMADSQKMDHGSMGHQKNGMTHKGMQHDNMNHDQMAMPKMDHGNMQHGSMNHGDMKMGAKDDPFYASGSGLMPRAANGGKFLSYKDLKAQRPLYEHRPADREIELRLTGNMERYIWSINGVKYEDADPIVLKYGERVRFKFVNETMMTHPMHLHGMWSILDTGSGKWNPVKHTISVAPGTTVYSETEVDAPGEWAFHCHLSYHADSGMFRKIVVEGGPKTATSNEKILGGRS
ncbi:copper resistance system multicopper oxidase [Sneathiella limimaris]|uniref:copper resistance system multicopper oxidase n=1 Tax=Sneathiella limimaris TaxID=1964213 RepID=UPI00146C57AF|nr:copper resistance system multicopper oxidase [Sneathiella limimaris]